MLSTLGHVVALGLALCTITLFGCDFTDDPSLRGCPPLSSACQGSVDWVMHTGISQHPEWYPTLSKSSNSHDVRCSLYGNSNSECYNDPSKGCYPCSGSTPTTPIRCGIASTLGECANDLNYLRSFDETTANTINCMGYGGSADPCTLSLKNDGSSNGLDKNPSHCRDGIFWLWDEPKTQLKSLGTWDAQQVATMWKDYVGKWRSELRQRRQEGMIVTSPLFTNHNNNDGHDDINVEDLFQAFFSSCSECSQKGSDYYIDALAWNAWIGNWGGSIDGQVDWIFQKTSLLKSNHGGRQVFLSNFAYLHGNAATQAQVLRSRIMRQGAGNPLSGVWWFAAIDYNPDGTLGSTESKLKDQLGGRTIGQELLDVCKIA